MPHMVGRPPASESFRKLVKKKKKKKVTPWATLQTSGDRAQESVWLISLVDYSGQTKV